MKRILLSITLNLLAITNVFAQVPASTRIAAVVNQKMISYTDLNHRVKLAMISADMPNTPEVLREVRQQILNVMIEEKLQQILGDEFKIKIDDTMVGQSMREIENQNNMAEGDFQKMLASHGIPLEAMKDHIRSSIIWREYIRQRYGNSIQISDEEVEKALNSQENQNKTTRVLMAEILIHTNQDTPVEKARAIAQKISTQLDGGRSQFAALAQQFSNAPSASRGGNVGWVSVNSLDEKVRGAVAHMQAGSLSKPIQTDSGFYILLVRDRLDPGQFAKPQTFVSLKQIMLPHPANAFEFEIQENMNRAHAMAKSVNGCRMVDKLAKGKNMHVQDIRDVPIENLQGDLRKLVDGLAENQTSKPLFTPAGAVLFTVCKKETIQPEKPTKESIRAKLQEKKLQLVADREMRNRRLAAHIDIRP